MVAEKHILVVDDEQSIREIMTDALELQGYRVTTAKDGEEALQCCEQYRFDLAVVDMRMPGKLDGLDVLREIRVRWSHMVVIILTAYATMDTAIEAMRDGAYDYLVKPAGISQILESIEHGLERSDKDFNLRRLISNMEEILKSLKQQVGIPVPEDPGMGRFIQTPALTIDRQKRLVVKDGKPLMLTSTEFDLLDFLASQPERVVTSQELIRAVQGYEISETDARPIVRVHIRRLRQKLEENPDQPGYILNVRGKGYRFVG